MYVAYYIGCVASETSGSVMPDPYLFLYLFVRNIGYADADCLGEQRSHNKFGIISGLKDQSWAVLLCFKFFADYPSKYIEHVRVLCVEPGAMPHAEGWDGTCTRRGDLLLHCVLYALRGRRRKDLY